jgi:L-iditol 2-dehydrogenase
MKLTQYLNGGEVQIVDVETPPLPPRGLVVKSEASGLCSGELMDWYMESKAPHVLGHEVSGIVIESQDDRFPVGSRVAPHHHAPCMSCEFCRTKRYVFCEQWRKTSLKPGGMSEFFAVSAENLIDTYRVDDLAPTDAALVEPLGCVAKSIFRSRVVAGERVAVIGLGTMGLMHALAMPSPCIGYELKDDRLAWAKSLGIDTRKPGQEESADVVFVCPGSESALHLALKIAAPAARIVLFAPLLPGKPISLDLGNLYFQDYEFINSYSCGPNDTAQALKWLRGHKVRAEQVVSHFVALDELPKAYKAMQQGEILKAMVIFA